MQPDPPHRDWTAGWISHPTAPLRDPVVLHFRRTLTLEAVPESYVVRVSADNRFILFVNGHRVGDGPARGDLPHWRYEKFDLAPLLQPGQNFITATVWNFGVYAPIAQFSDRTAFLLESEATGASSISTPKGWMVEIEPGQMPLGRNTVSFQAYMASGPGEQIDAARYDWDWNNPAATGTAGAWVPAASPLRDSIYSHVNQAHSADTTGDNSWGLVPDKLPHMEYAPTSAGQNVRSDLPALKAFPAAPVTVPAGSHVRLLLDRKTLTTAFKERGIVLEQVLLRNVLLPEQITKAINDKIAADQEAQKMIFVLQKEKQEAERKRIEAEGQAKAQQIVSQSLTPQILEYQRIQALRYVGEKGNLIITGGGGATPLIQIPAKK